MKLLFIVVLSLLAVSYARGQTTGNHTSLRVGGRKLLSEIFKCFETARNATKLVIL